MRRLLCPTIIVFLLTSITAASGLYLKALACGIDIVLETYRQKLVTVEQKVGTGANGHLTANELHLIPCVTVSQYTQPVLYPALS